jgi:hypothetical protein
MKDSFGICQRKADRIISFLMRKGALEASFNPRDHMREVFWMDIQQGRTVFGLQSPLGLAIGMEGKGFFMEAGPLHWLWDFLSFTGFSLHSSGGTASGKRSSLVSKAVELQFNDILKGQMRMKKDRMRGAKKCLKQVGFHSRGVVSEGKERKGKEGLLEVSEIQCAEWSL